MRAHKADIHDSVGTVDLHHQTIFVPGDIEANPVVFQDAGVSVVRLHLRWSFPVRLLRELEPGLERLLGVRMPVPEFLKRFAGDKPHRFSISVFPFWDQTHNGRKFRRASRFNRRYGFTCVGPALACFVEPVTRLRPDSRAFPSAGATARPPPKPRLPSQTTFPAPSPAARSGPTPAPAPSRRTGSG